MYTNVLISLHLVHVFVYVKLACTCSLEVSLISNEEAGFEM